VVLLLHFHPRHATHFTHSYAEIDRCSNPIVSPSIFITPVTGRNHWLLTYPAWNLGGGGGEALIFFEDRILTLSTADEKVIVRKYTLKGSVLNIHVDNKVQLHWAMKLRFLKSLNCSMIFTAPSKMKKIYWITSSISTNQWSILYIMHFAINVLHVSAQLPSSRSYTTVIKKYSNKIVTQ